MLWAKSGDKILYLQLKSLCFIPPATLCIDATKPCQMDDLGPSLGRLIKKPTRPPTSFPVTPDRLLDLLLAFANMVYMRQKITSKSSIVRLLQTFKGIDLIDGETENERDHPKLTVTLVVASANGCKVRLTR